VTSDFSFLESWLKLRSAIEQRNYWFLLALSGALLGMVTQWKTVYCASTPAKVVFGALAAAAVVVAGLMTVANVYDSWRLNALANNQTLFRVWVFVGFAPGVAGLVFLCLMLWFSKQISSDPRTDALCVE